MVAPSGEQHEIESGPYTAVVTESGATLRSLSYADRALVDGFPEHVMAAAGRGQVLSPWPNRLRDGAFSFGGHELQLALSEPARHNASHGLVRWASWQVLERSAGSVRLGHRLLAQSGYPWTLDLELTYALGDDGLSVTHVVTNRAAERAPYAIGFHPYLLAGGGPVDGWELRLPASLRLLMDDRKLPVGEEPVDGTPYDFRESRPIADTVLDDAFGELSHDDGEVRVSLTDPATGHGVELWADPSYSWLQVYTADDQGSDAHGEAARRSLAVEPMTAPPDALRSGRDLIVLEPEESRTLRWGLRAT